MPVDSNVDVYAPFVCKWSIQLGELENPPETGHDFPY